MYLTRSSVYIGMDDLGIGCSRTHLDVHMLVSTNVSFIYPLNGRATFCSRTTNIVVASVYSTWLLPLNRIASYQFGCLLLSHESQHPGM